MREAEYLRQQAEECRSAALRAKRREDARALRQLAGYYEKEADKLDAGTLAVLH